jgi:hypothetical protein
MSAPYHRLDLFALAACAWAVVFALVSTYWALGGEIGIDQLAQSIQNQLADNDSSLWLQNWLGVAAKCVWALLAFHMYRRVHQRLARQIILVLGWATGVLLTLYGIAGTFEKLLMQFGAIEVAKSIGEDALIWYLLLWDPWRLLGGILFIAAVRRYEWETR